jgi:molecular chaperone GrpE
MTKQTKIRVNSGEENDVPEESPGDFENMSEDAPDAADGSPEEIGGPEGVLGTPVTDGETEARDNYDRYLRVSAEFDNYKKRAAREKEDFRKYALEAVFRELLTVVDNLERALHSSGSGKGKVNGLVEGVDLTLKELLRIFEKFGVEPKDSLQAPFDPTFHQAVMQQEAEGVPDNTVISEIQKGYTINGRLLRPAMVVVSKSTPPGDAEEN